MPIGQLDDGCLFRSASRRNPHESPALYITRPGVACYLDHSISQPNLGGCRGGRKKKKKSVRMPYTSPCQKTQLAGEAPIRGSRTPDRSGTSTDSNKSMGVLSIDAPKVQPEACSRDTVFSNGVCAVRILPESSQQGVPKGPGPGSPVTDGSMRPFRMATPASPSQSSSSGRTSRKIYNAPMVVSRNGTGGDSKGELLSPINNRWAGCDTCDETSTPSTPAATRCSDSPIVEKAGYDNDDSGMRMSGLSLAPPIEDMGLEQLLLSIQMHAAYVDLTFV